MRNDCFANSSVQAYSSLPGLTEYLNKFIKAFNLMMDVMSTFEVEIDEIIPLDSLRIGQRLRSNEKENTGKLGVTKGKLEIRLHVALAKIVSKLQETQMTTKTISVWTFLHVLERIYNARISRSQHDAHELTQLINETLESENVNCIKVLKAVKEHFAHDEKLSGSLEAIEFPEFPFNGLVLSQMKCLQCSSVSKPHIVPFLMLTLHPPQELSTSIEDLLDENESETITGYQCIKCRILRIVDHELHLTEEGKSIDAEAQHMIYQLKELNSKDELFINDDLATDLDSFVKNYDRHGLKIADVTSSVFRRTQILKPPKVFGIHLSRSAFNGVTLSRNPCRVSFNDKLTLSIGKEYLADIQKFQQDLSDDAHLPNLHSKVLTTDTDDMEDDSVQREDIEVTGEDIGIESEDRDTDSHASTDSELSDDGDAQSISSTETTQATAPTSSDISTMKPELLQNTSITKDETVSLSKHFRKFNFSESNNYRYRLKAIIRHQGSHTQGHYECYKRKPLFVKDSEGNIIKLSPEIDEESAIQAEEYFSEDKAGQKIRTSSDSTVGLQETVELGERGHFRRKFSMIINRRPSVIQADPNQANVQEIINSGLTTPAEVLVDEYFQLPTAEEILNQLKKVDEPSKVKLKKIPSVIKHPYWRIGDSQIAEVSRSAVLFETTSVYMLYYERIDRKQVRS